MSVYSESWRLFNVRNVYDVLDIPPESMPRQIREAAYQLILHEHPDLKPPSDRKESFDKCRLVHKILLILTDTKRRADYDKCGNLEPLLPTSQMELGLSMLLDQCLALMKFPLDGTSVRENFLRNYEGSLLEMEDIKAAYLLGKGSMDRILTEVPLMTVNDEKRVKKIIKGLIKTKQLIGYKKFQNDAADQRRRRKKRYAVFTVESEQNKAMDKLLVKYNKDLDVEAINYNNNELNANTPARPGDILLTHCHGDMNAVLKNLTSKYGSDSSIAVDWDHEEQLQQGSSPLRSRPKSTKTMPKVTMPSKFRKKIVRKGNQKKGEQLQQGGSPLRSRPKATNKVTMPSKFRKKFVRKAKQEVNK